MPWAGQIYFYGGYNSKAKPFDDVRVRQAANYAVDREGMAKALGFGVGEPYYWPQWGPGILGYDENHPKYPYDPAKAKKLLQGRRLRRRHDLDRAEDHRPRARANHRRVHAEQLGRKPASRPRW